MTEKNKKPKIRFEGFGDDWEQCEFKNVFNHLQNNSLSRAMLDYEEGEIFNVHYGDILVKYGECLDVNLETLPRIMNNDFGDKYRASYLDNGDVIIADAAEDEIVGKCCEIKGLSNELILSGLHTIPCRPLMKFATGYLGYFMNSNAYHDKLLPLMQGTKVSSISKSAIADTYIKYPKDINEQEKIGRYFIELDNLITLHQHKYNKLLNIKKAMLEKMFPKENNNIPEIRFRGYTDVWEQRELGDVIDGLYNGQTPSRYRDDFWKGDINWLSSGELNLSIVENTVEKITKSGREAANLRLVPKGTFVMAITGLEAEGTRGNCSILGIDTTLNQSCMAIYPNKKLLSTSFLFQWYRKVGEDYGIRFTQGTKQQSYNAEIIKKLEICLPKIDEQVKIAEYLFKVDNLIILHQHQLEKLKNIKKACLEKMFI